MKTKMPGNNSSAMASTISSCSLERWFYIASKNLFQLSRIIQESPDTGSVLLVSRTGQKISRTKLNFALFYGLVWVLVRLLQESKSFFHLSTGSVTFTACGLLVRRLLRQKATFNRLFPYKPLFISRHVFKTRPKSARALLAFPVTYFPLRNRIEI